jgi:hypothetical protein
MEQKTSEKPLEEQTPAELELQIHNYKRTIVRSALLALTALVAIIALCLAWFLNNSRVTTQGIQLSAALGGFELASVGTDGGIYKDELNGLVSNAGETATIDSHTAYKTSAGQQNVVWRMAVDGSDLNNASGKAASDQAGIAPDTAGTLRFYVIPYQDGELTVEFTLSILAYSTDKDGKLIALEDRENDPVATMVGNLLKGHVLFFEAKNSQGLYEGLIENDTFTKTFQNAKAGQPELVTIYWVWPNVVAQLLQENPPYGALFTADVRSALQKDMTTGTGMIKYFLTTDEDKLPDLNESVIGQSIAALSTYYNRADEYIGKNADYILLRLEAQQSQAQEANTSDGTQSNGQASDTP